MPEIPTLRDVAAAAGVSKSTAQRALSNDPRCSPKTREIVLRVATEINYVPDPIFAAVGTRRRTRKAHGTPVAYLVALADGRQESGAKYFPWCEERAAELGYRLEMIDIAQLEAPKRLWQMLYARGFAGVLIGSVRSKFHPLLMENRQFPAVCAGRIDYLPYHTARPAIQLGVRRTWDEMIRLGYRRIGAAIFQHSPPLEDDFSRFTAVVGLPLLDLPNETPIPPLTNDFKDPSKFLPWVKRHQPDAIIAFHDGLLYDLKNAGYSIPQDIGFASLHIDERTDPAVSGICENSRVVAISSMNFLDQMIRHGERGVPKVPINLMIEGTWVPGKTLRAPIKKRKRVTS